MIVDTAKILVVDDEKKSLRSLEAMLLSLGYQVILANNGEEAIEKVRQTPPEVILLDSLMPKMDGFEVTRHLKGDGVPKTISLIMMTARVGEENRAKALKAGADDLLTKPVSRTELKVRIDSVLKLRAYYNFRRNYQEEMEAEVAKRTESLKQALEKVHKASLDTVYRLSRAAEYKDVDTSAHIERMSHYSAAIANQLGLNQEFREFILYAAPMHDIGKIGIPDRVLLKPSELDPDEWEIMKQHTTIGAQILQGAEANFIKLAEVIALTHHEKWDGSGYPQGLKGPEIPLSGRIVAIADVFDALTSERLYKSPLPLEKSFAIIKEGRGSHFDPEVVDAFFAIEDKIVAKLNRWQFLSENSAPQ